MGGKRETGTKRNDSPTFDLLLIKLSLCVVCSYIVHGLEPIIKCFIYPVSHILATLNLILDVTVKVKNDALKLLYSSVRGQTRISGYC